MLRKLKLAVVVFAGALAMPGVVRADVAASSKAADAAKAASTAADTMAEYAAKLVKAVADAGKSDRAKADAKAAAAGAREVAKDAVQAAKAATAAAKTALTDATKAKAGDKIEAAVRAASVEAAKSELDVQAAAKALDNAETSVPLAEAASSAAKKAAASAVIFATAAAAAKSAWTAPDVVEKSPEKTPEKQALQVQTFSLPAFSTTAEQGDSLLWFGVGTFVCLALTIVLLALAGFRLNDPPSSNMEAVEGLNRSLSGLIGQAASAKQRYDEARMAAANAATPMPAPQPTYRQETVPPAESRASGTISRQDIVKTWDPPHVEPTTPTITGGPISGSWPRAGMQAGSEGVVSGVVGDYQRVRASGDGREVDKFEANYHFVRISCVNFDDLRTNPNASLRFQEAQRGSLLLVNDGSQTLAFPWFATDLVQERERLEGIFQYYDSGGANLRVAKPAVLDKQGANWVMRVPGSVQADV